MRTQPLKLGDKVTVDGEIWEIVNIGKLNREHGTRYMHLASTTRFSEQAGGRVPKQIGRWL